MRQRSQPLLDEIMKAFLLIFNFEIANFKIYGIKQSQNAFRLPVSTPHEGLDISAWRGVGCLL